MATRIQERTQQLKTRLWKLADTNVPLEWPLLVIGTAAILIFIFIIVFGVHPGK